MVRGGRNSTRSNNSNSNQNFSNNNNKKVVERSSGIIPFLFTPEEWPKDVPTQIIETTESGNKLKTKMDIFQGDKT